MPRWWNQCQVEGKNNCSHSIQHTKAHYAQNQGFCGLLCLYCSFSWIWNICWIRKLLRPSYNMVSAVVKQLVKGANLNSSWGHIQYTDNWYTSIMFSKTLFEKCRWRFCGTQVAMEKNACSKLNLPFNMLSKGALKQVYHGWFCETAVEIKMPNAKTYWIMLEMERQAESNICSH